MTTIEGRGDRRGCIWVGLDGSLLRDGREKRSYMQS